MDNNTTRHIAFIEDAKSARPEVVIIDRDHGTISCRGRFMPRGHLVELGRELRPEETLSSVLMQMVIDSVPDEEPEIEDDVFDVAAFVAETCLS